MQKHYEAIAKAMIEALQDKEMRRLDLLRLFLVLQKCIGKIIDRLIDITFRDVDDNFRDMLSKDIRRDN